MEIYQYTIEDLNDYANQVKDVVLTNLLESKVITAEQHKTLSKTKIISNIRLSKISMFFKRLIKNSEVNGLRVIVSTAEYLKDEFEELPVTKNDVREALK